MAVLKKNYLHDGSVLFFFYFDPYSFNFFY
jgi:hypothetical protein